MLHTLPQMLAPAVMERVTLLLNHVLAAEPVATQRLLPHAGKSVQVEAQGWPAWLPPLPALAWRVTPAGLLEWCGPSAESTPELRLTVDARQPPRLLAAWLAGERPDVSIGGDAQLAGDVDWLMQNLRWDLAADLERLFPPPLALALQQGGSALARGLRGALQGLQALQQRWQPRPGA
ncbi:MAG: hypothetical protein U1F56_13590 [Rubrivivax sp.]